MNRHPFQLLNLTPAMTAPLSAAYSTGNADVSFVGWAVPTFFYPSFVGWVVPTLISRGQMCRWA